MIYLVSFLLSLLFILLSITFWTWRNGISPMPSSFKAKNQLLASLPPTSRGIIYELGSGWGTLAFPIAQKFPECTVIGYETSLIPFLFSKLRHYLVPLSNLKFYRNDFFNVPLSDAAGIVCYLYPGAMWKLKIKFEQELKPGTWIVSNTFAIPTWSAEEIYEIKDLYHTSIYVYYIKR